MKIWQILSADIWRLFKRDLSETNNIFLADLVDLGFALSFNNHMAPCTQRGEVLSYLSSSIITIIIITRSMFHVPGTRLIFHDSRFVFMVFHGSRWGFAVFHCSRSVFMVFYDSTLVFHGFIMVQGRFSWFFMVPGGFSWFSMVPGWFVMVLSVFSWFFMDPGGFSLFFILPGWFSW